jgi:hypothetical protein
MRCVGTATLTPTMCAMDVVDCCVPYKGNEWWTESLGLPLVKPWRPWTVDTQVGAHEPVHAPTYPDHYMMTSAHINPTHTQLLGRWLCHVLLSRFYISDSQGSWPHGEDLACYFAPCACSLNYVGVRSQLTGN